MKSNAPNPAFTFITPNDVMAIITHITSYDGAWHKIKKIKQCLGKKKHQRLTVKEFAEWEGLDAQLIITTIYSS